MRQVKIFAAAALTARGLLRRALRLGLRAGRPFGPLLAFRPSGPASLTDFGNDTFSELIGTFTLRSPASETGGFEYALDTRFAVYPSFGRARGTRLDL